MKFFNKNLDSISIAQYFVIGSLVSITISPPLVNIFIALSLIATMSISTIRNQLLEFFRTKLGYACIAFILVLFSGLIYGIETNNVIASSIWGWRKFLMLPIAAAVFMNAPHAKQNLINSFWFVCLILMIYSFFIYTNSSLSGKYAGGVVVRNYVTQGIFFSAATIIALANTLNSSLSIWQRAINGVSIPFFIFNISIIAIGRSGYIAIIVMLVSFIFTRTREGSVAKNIVISALGLFFMIGLFLTTPASKNRIDLAKQEFIAEISESKGTSIGDRLSFWKNTLELLPKYALIGTGTGGFSKAYANQIKEKSLTAEVLTGDPHNQYLKILIEHGVVGLVIFLSIIMLLLKQPVTDPFRAIGFASIIAISTTSLFNSHFSTFNEGQFIWILAGAILASEKSTQK